MENKYWFYNTFSASSYSETPKRVNNSITKEHNLLIDINLTLFEKNLDYHFNTGKISNFKTFKILDVHKNIY